MRLRVGRPLCQRQAAANAVPWTRCRRDVSGHDVRDTMNEKLLGVLGGMGPLASAQFMVRLTLLTPAMRDQDHIPTVLWSDPRVPDRTVGRLSGGADPL